LFHSIFKMFRRDESSVYSVLGQKMSINPNRSVLEMKLWLIGMYEPEVVELFLNELRRGDVVVDVGANIGLFTLMAADIVGPQGRVIAYEPHPKTYRELCANVERNRYDNTILVQEAISNSRGIVQMNVFTDCDLNSVALSDDCGMINVPADTLDSSLAQLGVCRCDLLKIDIEGAEWFALRGMDRTIEANPGIRLLIELHNPQIRALGGEPELLLQLLLDRGFSLYELNMWRGKTPILSASNTSIHGHLLCIREHRTPSVACEPITTFLK
jgi:FkbM family methyltransferase